VDYERHVTLCCISVLQIGPTRQDSLATASAEGKNVLPDVTLPYRHLVVLDCLGTYFSVAAFVCTKE
jgi:hypothetical protein